MANHKGLEQSSLDTYAASLRRWKLFCKEEDIDPHEPTIAGVITFLGCSGSTSIPTLQRHISAIASECLNPGRVSYPATSIAAHPLVHRYLRAVAKTHGMEKCRSAAEPFDIRILVDHIHRLGQPGELSMTRLAHCAVVMVRIHTRHRCSDLARYRRESIVQDSRQITGWISAPKEHRGLTVRKWSRRFVVTATESETCAFRYLEEYLRRLGTREGPVFLTIKKPTHAASKDTISRWCRSLMTEAGLDSQIYPPHSICAAAASAAFNIAKASVQDLEQHRWARNSAALRRSYLHVGINDAGFALESAMESTNTRIVTSEYPKLTVGISEVRRTEADPVVDEDMKKGVLTRHRPSKLRQRRPTATAAREDDKKTSTSGSQSGTWGNHRRSPRLAAARGGSGQDSIVRQRSRVLDEGMK
jgi:hypothetical protein